MFSGESNITKGKRLKIPLSVLAAKAGVSVATASRVVSGSIPVSPEMENKVRVAMNELGYHASVGGGHLQKKGHSMIGFLTVDLAGATYDDFRSGILRGVEQALRKRKGHMMLAGYAEEMAEDRLPAMVAQNIISGLIIEGTQFASQEWIQRVGQCLPTVLVMHAYPDRKLPSVMCDNEGGTYQAIEYLRQMGHSNIGFLSVCDVGQPLCLHHEERRQAFLNYAPLLGCKLSSESVQILDRDQSREELNATIARGLRHWLKMGDRRPTAIVCAAGIYAAVFCAEVQKAGLDVPRDFSVIGFENTRQAQFFQPPLTCISDSLEEIGASAVDLLFTCMKSPESSARQIRVSMQLVERQSCRRL